MLAHLSLNFVLGISGAPLATAVFWWTLVLGSAVALSLALLSFRGFTVITISVCAMGALEQDFSAEAVVGELLEAILPPALEREPAQ